ncbi:MAG TPA: polyprenyl synthetase family protein [Pirellulales bacterium]|nr:polyprenyl synthetase family protein [Pirellulales bacterium]
MRAKCAEVAARLDKSRPLGKEEMEAVARSILAELQQPEGFLGWTMVVLASEFWREQVAAIPPSRRLFLLPHCLKHAEGCPADYDEFGLDCRQCGACSIADFRSIAEDLGYKVLVAEGSPIVLKIIVSGYVDAIVGVACLNVLEKAIDKILLAGIPCMAVPLLSSDCRNTSVDDDWVQQLIQLQGAAPAAETSSYLHLMRAAAQLFERENLERLVPRLRGGPSLAEANGHGIAGLDPLAGTEALAYDFLGKGGKHSRPFITLAVYDALSGAQGTAGDGAAYLAGLPDAVKRVAMSIETFHKASLVHDDIEDNDAFRYGAATLHQQYGVPTAINVGDYLIGFGYRLVSREIKSLGAEVVADILDKLADAHLKLSEGQGAELLWRDARDKSLSPLDALKIYALKTAPAFEAALYSGARMAGSVERYAEPISQFARHLGVAFQILNDLNDWEQDDHNKLKSGGDLLGGRPTVLWALALEHSTPENRRLLQSLAAVRPLTPANIAEIRRLYEAAGVFDKALRLVDKYQERAESVADALEPDALRRLFYYLVDTVLERKEPAAAEREVVAIQPLGAV